MEKEPAFMHSEAFGWLGRVKTWQTTKGTVWSRHQWVQGDAA